MGSILVVGPETNRLMTHELVVLAEPPAASLQSSAPNGNDQKDDDDNEYYICITFRQVATHQHTSTGTIFGKGAPSDTLAQALQEQRNKTSERRGRETAPWSIPATQELVARQRLKTAFLLEQGRADFDSSYYYQPGFSVCPFQYVTTVAHTLPLLHEQDKDTTTTTNEQAVSTGKSTQVAFPTADPKDTTVSFSKTLTPRAEQHQPLEDSIEPKPKQQKLPRSLSSSTKAPSTTSTTLTQLAGVALGRIRSGDGNRPVRSFRSRTATTAQDAIPKPPNTNVINPPGLPHRDHRVGVDSPLKKKRTSSSPSLRNMSKPLARRPIVVFSEEDSSSQASTSTSDTTTITTTLTPDHTYMDDDDDEEEDKQVSLQVVDENHKNEASDWSNLPVLPASRRPSACTSLSKVCSAGVESTVDRDANRLLDINDNSLIRTIARYREKVAFKNEHNTNDDESSSVLSKRWIHKKAPDSPSASLRTHQSTNSKRSYGSHKRVSHHNGIALLALDLQNDFLGDDDPSFFLCQMGASMAPRRAALLERIGDLANQVRSVGGVVFFLKSRYGAWSPSSSKRRQAAAATQSGGLHQQDSHADARSATGAEFHPDVVKQVMACANDGHPNSQEDIVLIKEWYSAFMGTTLHGQLQRLQVKHLVVCGVSTNHSVAATVRSASNHGYNVILSSDGTTQIDESQQAATLKKLQTYYSVLLHKDQTIASVVSPDPCYGMNVDHTTEPTHDSLLLPSESEVDASVVSEEESSTCLLEFDAIGRLSGFGAGDSVIIPDFLDKAQATELFQTILFSTSSFSSHIHELMPSRRPALSTHDENDRECPLYLRAEEGSLQPWNLEEECHMRGFSEVMKRIQCLAESQTGHALNMCQIQRHGASTSTAWAGSLTEKESMHALTSSSSSQDPSRLLELQSKSFVAALFLGGDRVLELDPHTTTNNPEAVVALSGTTASLAPQRVHVRHNTLVLLGSETTRRFAHSISSQVNDGNGRTPPLFCPPQIQCTFLNVVPTMATTKIS